ncbi:hypothetical protein VTN00DRAFT_2543 [Thermoascus crustaceus]|uniref:uncharacterized protein n=1 Tax=Thermoascus crustaceus TaxID=5088 RepID=UPI003741F96C
MQPSLQITAVGQTDRDSHPDVVAWKQRHPGLLDDDYPKTTAGHGGTGRGIHSVGNMNWLIKLHPNSLPGNLEVTEHELMYARALNLYKLPKIERWSHTQGYRTETYDCETFRRLSELVSDSRLFYLNPADTKIRYGPYYRKPAQYLAAATAAAGYNGKEVMDVVTRRYLRSVRSDESISRLSMLLKDSWRESKRRTSASSQFVSIVI